MNVLLGIFASFILIDKKLNDKKRLTYLIGGGLVMVLLGYLWSMQLPIIKKIWTSTYVLISSHINRNWINAYPHKYQRPLFIMQHINNPIKHPH